MKARKIFTVIMTAIASLMVVFSGFLKLIRSEAVMQTLTNAGVGDSLTLLAFMEIGFTILFIIPKTSKLGFILLSCYFAGAMATELSHHGPVLNAAIPLVLVWIAAFLRDRSIFLPASKEANSLGYL